MQDRTADLSDFTCESFPEIDTNPDDTAEVEGLVEVGLMCVESSAQSRQVV